ncbi:MAG: hypothetical protein LBV21_01585 [Candidatus Adiutrix sp.]|nr:hypothetical protein [Candidatus Adiutrix sp.]
MIINRWANAENSGMSNDQLAQSAGLLPHETKLKRESDAQAAKDQRRTLANLRRGTSAL